MTDPPFVFTPSHYRQISPASRLSFAYRVYFKICPLGTRMFADPADNYKEESRSNSIFDAAAAELNIILEAIFYKHSAPKKLRALCQQNLLAFSSAF
jgi:hypothetical protein